MRPVTVMSPSFAVGFVSLFIVGCQPPEPQWLYGSWTEPLSGQVIDFSQDGTVHWMGEAGAYRLSSGSGGVCFDRCPDGTIVVDVGTQTIKIPYRTSSPGTAWTFRSNESFRVQDIDGLGTREAKSLTLMRDAAMDTYRPDGFTRFDNGLDWYYNTLRRSANLQGQLIAEHITPELQVVRFSDSTSRWEFIEVGGWLSDVTNIRIGGNVMMTWGWDANKFSIDLGHSWGTVPDLSTIVPGVGIREPQFIETRYFQLMPEPSSGSENPRESAVYVVDLADAVPAWQRVETLPAGFDSQAYTTTLYSQSERHELYVVAKENGALSQSHMTLLKSTNEGSSWTEHRPPFDAIVNRGQPTISGLVLPGFHPSEPGERFYFFDAEQEHWSEVALPGSIYIGSWTVQGDSVIALVSGRDQILKIDSDGQMTSRTVELRSAGLQNPTLVSARGEVFLNAFTLWKLDDDFFSR